MSIAAALPWWVGISLAAISFLVLHQFSDLSISQPVQAEQMGNFAVYQLFKTFAFFGQLILPICFVVGSIVSFTKERREKNRNFWGRKQPSLSSILLNKFLFISGISWWFIFLLSVSIVSVTVLCVYIFDGAKDYLLFLSALFIFSAIKAIKGTSPAVEVFDEPKQPVINLFTKAGSSTAFYAHEQAKKLGHEYQEPIVELQPKESEQVNAIIPLEQYLLINNYNLNSEIVDAIEWKRFELLCHLIFQASGHNPQLTGNGADQGVDIRIYDKDEPDKILYLVQCKKWKRSKKIDRSMIQQLRGQMAFENVGKGGYCSTATYSSCAKEFAAANNIELFDQLNIIETFNKLEYTIRQSILKKLLEGDYWTPSCASCGQKFEQTSLKSGRIVWGCSNSRSHGWSSIPYYEAMPIQNVQP